MGKTMEFSKREVYGVVYDGYFISGKVYLPMRESLSDGFYSIDISSDDLIPVPADLFDFRRFVTDSDRMFFRLGFSFREGFIPMNNIYKFQSYGIPVPVIGNFGSWEMVQVLEIRNRKVSLFIQWPENPIIPQIQDTLWKVKELFDENKSLQNVPGITPELRLLFTLYSFDKIRREQELAQLEREQFLKSLTGRLKSSIEMSGGIYKDHKEISRGRIEVDWELDGKEFNTLLNPDFSVVEAGVCVSGDDDRHNMTSLVNRVGDFERDGSYYEVLRTRK